MTTDSERSPSAEGEPFPVMPVPRPSYKDQQAAVDRIKQAMAEDLVQFEELDERFAAVFTAETQGDLDQVVADLPVLTQPPPPADARHIAPGRSFGLIGGIDIGGWIAMGDNLAVTRGIGGATIDLSSATIPASGATITVRVFVGGATIIVPNGARVQVDSITLVGGKAENIVPAVPDGPVIRIKGFVGVGGLGVYSLSRIPKRLLPLLNGRAKQLGGAGRSLP